MKIEMPDLNIKAEEIKLLLAVKLFEDGIVSLGRAAFIAGYTERSFAEILTHKGIPPVRYQDLDLEEEKNNA